MKGVSENLIRELKQKFVNYEHWLISGFTDPKPAELPVEYLKLFNQKPEAYNIYRQATFKFIQQLSGRCEILNGLEKLVASLTKRNSDGFSQITDFFNSLDLTSKFKEEWSNTFETSKLIQKNEITHEICYFYQSKYEIDELLFFLAAIRKLLTDNIVDLSLKNLRDKRGAIKKGVMVDYISAGLKKYPKLKYAIDKAYIPKLRNTIGHNNYTIRDGLIKSLDGTITVSQKEFFESLYNIQELHNSIIWILANIGCRNDLKTTCDCGIISIGFGYDKKNILPVINLFQLWCFFENDTHRTWLKKVVFETKNKELHTLFTPIASFKGLITSALVDWLKDTRCRGNVLIKISSVIPFIGDEDLKLELGWGTYQVTADHFEVILPIEMKGNSVA
jgi:hypothetical protein